MSIKPPKGRVEISTIYFFFSHGLLCCPQELLQFHGLLIRVYKWHIRQGLQVSQYSKVGSLFNGLEGNSKML